MWQERMMVDNNIPIFEKGTAHTYIQKEQEKVFSQRLVHIGVNGVDDVRELVPLCVGGGRLWCL